MKKLLPLALISLFLAQPLAAQNPAQHPAARPAAPSTPPAPTPALAKGSGKITGTVLDEAAKKPVQFATVTLLQVETGKIADGTLTDEKGRFALARLPAGAYQLSVTFLGYETKLIQRINLDKGEVNVGTVGLKTDAKALKEVEVVGQKALVEDQVDRLVYNAEKDLTTVGGTAGDVLKKVPGLTVDLEGNVQLRGSSNLRVLINNKPSSMMASSLADALRQIPADLIKSVEVITNPSAKYDAEGTAGIVNIITKKNSLQGFNGTANAAAGNRVSQGMVNLNYRKGKFGLNNTLGRSWRNNPLESRGETFYNSLPTIDRLSQQMTGERGGVFNMVQLGADYDLTKKSSLAAGLRMQTGTFTYETNQTSSQFRNNTLTNRNTRDNRNEFDNLNFDLNLDYVRQFAKPGQELSVLGLLSRSNRQNYGFADLYNRDNQLDRLEQNLNDAYNDEKTFQADYTHPLKNKRLLELGAKAILRYAESDYRFLFAAPATAPLVGDPDRTDVFTYHQDVAATYATYGFSLLKKYNVKAGARYEYTHVDGDFNTTRTAVAQDYGNLIPSIALSRTLKNNQTVKFNYTKRIQRPQLGYLNPFENRTDTFNIQVGNPNLRAELTNAYEVGYSTFFKSGTALTAALFWRQTNNSIQAYTLPTAEGVNYTTFANIGRNASYGMSLFGNTRFLKKGSLSGNVLLYYTDLASQSEFLRASNASVMYNASVNASYLFPKGISAQAAGEFNSRRVTLQGKTSALTTYNLAVRKDILQKKGSIGLALNNPFSPALKQRSTFQTPLAEQNTTTYLYARQYRLTASYRFGKTDSKTPPRRRKKITNDDAKADSEEQ